MTQLVSESSLPPLPLVAGEVLEVGTRRGPLYRCIRHAVAGSHPGTILVTTKRATESEYLDYLCKAHPTRAKSA